MNIEKFASLVVKIWRLRQQRERQRKAETLVRDVVREKELKALCRKLAA
jgi:hypothetical protein